MATPLRVLIVEDRRDDAEIVLRELGRAGFTPTAQIVDNEADFLAGLETDPHVVLSDFNLPRFDGLKALRLLRERKPSIPLIIVTGALGDERAAECMRQGAADYLLKDRLARLGAAVRRAVGLEATPPDPPAASEPSKPAAEQIRHLAAIVESASDAVVGLSRDGAITSWNGGAERLFGHPAAEALGRPATMLFPPEGHAAARRAFERALAGEILESEEAIGLTRAGARIVLSVTASPIRGDAPGVSLIARAAGKR